MSEQSATSSRRPPETDAEVVPPAGAAQVVASVLSDHVRGDWSDRTYTCQGCARRLQEHAEANWPQDPTERNEARSRVAHASKPDWTMADYNDHVAEHILAALYRPETTGSPQ